MQSALELAVGFIPSPTHPTSEPATQLFPEDIEIVKRPDEVEQNYLFRQAVETAIANSGSFNLSPFCLVIDSDVNMVEAADGTLVKWKHLLEDHVSPIKFKDTYYTTTSVKDISYTGKKQAYRYTLGDGNQIDCTPEHQFETIINGTIVDLPIQNICNLRLPLLKAKLTPSTLPIQYELPTHNNDGEELVYPTLNTGEELKHILGEECRYAVTSHGRVWSFNRTTYQGQSFPARWLSPSGHSTGGYLTVCLGHPSKQAKIHQLVATHFINNPFLAPEINHIDGNVANNDVTNLEWCTREYNMAKAYDRHIANSEERIFVGVHYQHLRKGTKKWCARVKPRGENRIFIGWFETQHEAALAYDEYVVSQRWHLAPFHVRLNFGEWVYPPQYPAAPVTAYDYIMITGAEDLGEVEVADITVNNSDHKYLLNGFRTHNSFNWNHLRNIYTILREFKHFTRNVPLSSCRLDAIAKDPGLAHLIANFSGSVHITSAVEGISERIRNFLQKSLTQEEFYVGVENIMAAGFNSIKFYYIFTGMENDDDVEEFKTTLDVINQLRHKHHCENMEIRCSFTPLHSTLGTPTEYHGSRVSQNLRLGDSVFHKIRNACAQANVGIRLSASPGSVDFGEIVEFGDRRTQPLIEYMGLNGTHRSPKLSVTLYHDPVPITEKEYAELPPAIKLRKDKKPYRTRVTMRLSEEKMYQAANDQTLYTEYHMTDIFKRVLPYDGKPLPDDLLFLIPESRRKEMRGAMVLTKIDQPAELIGRDPLGNDLHAVLTNMSITSSQADTAKTLLAYFTNGFTFNDIIADKSALSVLPNMHIRVRQSKSMAKSFSAYIASRSLIYQSYCFSDAASSCFTCGSCNTQQQVRSVSAPRTSMERGDTHLSMVLADHKNFNTYQKLVVAVRVKPGPYAAMRHQWLRHAVNRAIMLASDRKLVRPFIYDRYAHTRQSYKVKDEAFKSILAGQWILEINLNSESYLTPNKLPELLERAQQFTTPGWTIEGLRLLDPDAQLKNEITHHLVEFRIDDRRFPKFNPAELKEQIAYYNQHPNRQIKYRVWSSKNRQVVQSKVVKLDRDQIDFITIGTGANAHETVVRMMLAVSDAHPLTVFAGLTKVQEDKAGAHGSFYGVNTNIIGFYKKTENKGSGSSLFSLVEEHDHAATCSNCGGPRYTNVMTGLPFGGDPHEQQEGISDGDLCQKCWSILGR